ncbi:MAG: hypothetical protein IJ829_05785, partial [Kiritimatiellae bacterium]|nr:hypothetical protein [Kiritimatiellia bacterium]
EAPSSASAAGRTAGALKQAPGIAAARPAGRAKAESGGRVFDYVFLHDRDLSAAGAEMMAKIVAAMKMTRETAPLVCEGAVPPAKVLVVLGKFALQKWFPSLHGAPGQWLRGPQGECLLVTYSPEYILRFGSSSPAVRKLKLEMWAGLKAAMQRVQSGLT